jgi:RNA polymerase sigma-70 factor (ECF subfamily)
MTEENPETIIRTHLDRGEASAAVDATMRAYGPEILGLLTAVLNEPKDADDVFSRLGESVSREISRFAWDYPLRTWCYRLACLESARYRAAESRRFVGVGAKEIELRSAWVDRVDSEGRQALEPFTRLRSALQPRDRELLVLRVDRDLAWEDLARVFVTDGASAFALAEEVVRLQGQFRWIKWKLAREAKVNGLRP